MRVLALLTVIAVTFLVTPSVALAGGPTSVLITSPSENKATALYATQPDYSRLRELLGNQPVTDPNAPDLHGGPGTGAINVTWLIHDVQIWRVDRVFLNRPDGIWVETRQSWDSIKFDQPAILHRPTDQVTVAKLLYSVLATPSTQNANLRTVAETPPPPAPVAEGIHWTSLLIGLACGLVIVLAGRVVYGALWRRPA